MVAVVDTSTLISLAWSGWLRVVALSPVELVVPEAVQREAVADGVASGYPDASAIQTAIGPLAVLPRTAENTVDQMVLAAAVEAGTVLTNDLALGRRASNLGVRWLRTADLIVLCVQAGRLESDSGRSALRALNSAGRLTAEMLADYLVEV